ncbi:MAG: RDD family protein [Bacteroidales bacterium]|nr:RDD family protein [Bacteroidales bacterium]
MHKQLRIGKTALFTERILAASIDLSIVLGLSLFPRIGWLFGLIYFLFKDSLGILKGQSFGRRLFKIKVISLEDGNDLIAKPDKALIRQIVLLVPILNLIEVFYFFFRDERLGAKWSSTTVVKV